MRIFKALNEVVMKMVDLIMITAPYAVFALLANVIVAFDDADILKSLCNLCNLCRYRIAAYDNILSDSYSHLH